MSAEILQFRPRQQYRGKSIGNPRIASRAAAAPADRAMDHIDTSPCEYVGENPEETRIEDG